MSKINGNPQPEPTKRLSNDELLHKCTETLCIIANDAKELVELMINSGNPEQPPTPAEIQRVNELLAAISANTKGFDGGVSILGHLAAILATAAKSKTMLGAQLTVQKTSKTIHLKGLYGSGPNDYHDMVIDLSVAKQLCDGLDKAIAMISGKPRLIMPDSGIM